MSIPSWIWRMLFLQRTPFACALALLKAGNSIPARIAMIAITTRSSIRVNPAVLPRDAPQPARASGIVPMLLSCRDRNGFPNSNRSRFRKLPPPRRLQ
jgi:hypothetical protein